VLVGLPWLALSIFAFVAPRAPDATRFMALGGALFFFAIAGWRFTMRNTKPR
jgi:hypothetical protein